MRSHLLLLLLLLLAVVAIPVHSLVGGWEPIKNPNDPSIQGIAKFAINEYNAKAKGKLTFVSVKNAESQVVSGLNYRLIISATDGKSTGLYDAVVWVKADNSKELISFKPGH